MTRINDHPILGKITNQNKVSFQFNGEVIEGYENDTIASALLAYGIRTLRYHEATGAPRGIYCNIGHCFECRVTVNHTPNIRACLTPIKQDIIVESSYKLPAPLHPKHKNQQPRTYKEFEQWQEKGNTQNE